MQHGLDGASGETAWQDGAYDVGVGMDEADEDDISPSPSDPGGDDELNKDYDD